MSESKTVTLAQAAAFLRGAEDVCILAHASPDGDTLGSSHALCLALRALGKRAVVSCSDPIPQRFAFLTVPAGPAFTSQTVVSTDVADPKLLGAPNEALKDRVALCIDHHPSNTFYAARTLLCPTASSACEIIADVLDELRVEITPDIADRIYTGLATDTGCFRFGNTEAKTLRLAARLLEAGARTAQINKWMFDTVSRARLAAEQLVLQALEYHADGRVALVAITRAMREQTGVEEADVEGFASLTAQVEGVLVGITIREKDDGSFKLSLRTNEGMDASAICAHFGGGGHKAAAGCRMERPLPKVKQAILQAVNEALTTYERDHRPQ